MSIKKIGMLLALCFGLLQANHEQLEKFLEQSQRGETLCELFELPEKISTEYKTKLLNIADKAVAQRKKERVIFNIWRDYGRTWSLLVCGSIAGYTGKWCYQNIRQIMRYQSMGINAESTIASAFVSGYIAYVFGVVTLATIQDWQIKAQWRIDAAEFLKKTIEKMPVV